MLPSKTEALKPFESLLPLMVPTGTITELQKYGYKNTQAPQTFEDVLSWAYDKLSVVFDITNTENPTIKLPCYNESLNGIQFKEKRGKTLYDALIEALRLLIAIYLIINQDDYYFPEN